MIEYIKGPLGFAVVKDGAPVGSIKDYTQHGGWLLKLKGFDWKPLPGSVAEKCGVKRVPVRVFPSLKEAQAEVERLLK